MKFSRLEGTVEIMKIIRLPGTAERTKIIRLEETEERTKIIRLVGCLLYTSPSPRDGLLSRMPSSA